MKTALSLLICIALPATLSRRAGAEEALDPGKVRQLHQKARSGQQLTPEEQTYYERGKAARRQGEGEPRRTAASALAAPAAKSSTGLVPVADMSADDRYKGEDGGLYGGGRNLPPEAHLQAALAEAAKIEPLDAEGKPSPGGRIVLLTHGMSNTTMQSQQFITLASADSRKSPALLLIDGAQGGIDSRKWVAGTETRRGESPWDKLDERVASAWATPRQVQAVWMKHALARVGQYGDFPKHARQLKDDLAEIVRMLQQRYPNLKLVYVSSRTYAGYAATELNPEPYAYESAFAVRWLIQDQINGVESLSYRAGKAPLLLWGPYLWADGEKGRKAGDLAYKREDYRQDGTHPSDSGREKIGSLLLQFFSTDPTSKGWFWKAR